MASRTALVQPARAGRRRSKARLGPAEPGSISWGALRIPSQNVACWHPEFGSTSRGRMVRTPLDLGPKKGEARINVWSAGANVMRIERRFTVTGEDPYKRIEFRRATSEIRNPDGSSVFHLPNIEVPADWSQVACDILAQKYFRKAGVPARLDPARRERRSRLALAARARRGGDGRFAARSTQRIREKRQAGFRPPGRHLDLLGLEGRLFRQRGRRPRLSTTRCASCWPPDGRAQLAAMVQHRPALGLWHRRARRRATISSTPRPAS